MLHKIFRYRHHQPTASQLTRNGVGRVGKLLLVLTILMMIPSVGSAGGGGGGSLCDGFDSGDTVTMLDSCFAGTAHFATAGNTITVRNDGLLPHTFTAVDGRFDSGTVQPGGSFTLDVDETGTYKVFCSLHGTTTGQGMAGVLIVGDDDSAAAGNATHPPNSSDGSNGLIWAVLTAILFGGLALRILTTTRSGTGHLLRVNNKPTSVEP